MENKNTWTLQVMDDRIIGFTPKGSIFLNVRTDEGTNTESFTHYVGLGIAEVIGDGDRIITVDSRKSEGLGVQNG